MPTIALAASGGGAYELSCSPCCVHSDICLAQKSLYTLSRMDVWYPPEMKMVNLNRTGTTIIQQHGERLYGLDGVNEDVWLWPKADITQPIKRRPSASGQSAINAASLQTGMAPSA